MTAEDSVRLPLLLGDPERLVVPVCVRLSALLPLKEGEPVAEGCWLLLPEVLGGPEAEREAELQGEAVAALVAPLEEEGLSEARALGLGLGLLLAEAAAEALWLLLRDTEAVGEREPSVEALGEPEREALLQTELLRLPVELPPTERLALGEPVREPEPDPLLHSEPRAEAEAERLPEWLPESVSQAVVLPPGLALSEGEAVPDALLPMLRLWELEPDSSAL